MTTNIKFDPSVHLAYAPPAKTYTMDDLGLKGQGVAKVGITEPFPLLSAEGVRALRGNVFTKAVLDNYSESFVNSVYLALLNCALIIFIGVAVSSKLSSCQVRGMGSDNLACFVKNLWSHPETVRACSEAAGMELVPIMPYEVPLKSPDSPRKSDAAPHFLCSSVTQTYRRPPAPALP